MRLPPDHGVLMFGLGKARLKAVAFDIIGTSFPLDPLRPRITALGLPPAGLEGWFAASLRDAFALALTGSFAPFAKVLEATLDATLAEQGLTASAADRKALIDGLRHLAPRPGAAEALSMLADAGIAVLALTNGSAASTRTLLDRADFAAPPRHIVSVDDVKRSKPAAEVYAHAAGVAGVKPGELALIAAHAWDIQGAHAAGLTTAYLSADRPFSAVMHAADVHAATLPDCAAALLAL